MRVIVIDDHPLVRDGLTSWIKSVWPEAGIHSVGSADAGLVQARYGADLVLLDLGLPNTSGAEALEKFRRLDPNLPVIVNTGSDNRLDMEACFRAGARGYVRKDSSPEVLIQVMKRVLAGESVFPTTMQPSAGPDIQELTPRQRDILQLMCVGHSNKEIAKRLGVEESTVKTHITAIFSALDVVNRTQAVVAARRYGWVTTESGENS